MGIQDLYKMLETYGFKGLLFGIIFFIIGTILKSSWFSNWWSKMTDKIIQFFMKKKVKEIPHGDFRTYSKIPTFQFSTDYRTVTFKKYLTIFLKCYKKGLSEFVQNREYHRMDQSQLWKSLLELINKIVWDYERECEEAGIPRIVVLKVKSKNNDTITLTIDLIESISNSQFYESEKNLLKMYSILNIILSILENTISNSQSVCNSINGQLKGLTITEGGKTYKEP